MCGQYFIDVALDHRLVQGVAMGFVVTMAHCAGKYFFVRLTLGVTEGPAGGMDRVGSIPRKALQPDPGTTPQESLMAQSRDGHQQQSQAAMALTSTGL